MKDIVVSATTAAPPSAVWQVITSLEESPDHLSGITAVERLDGGDGFGVGTRWRETRTMFGREATEVMEVTAVDEGRSYVVESHASDGTHYRSTLSVAPRDGGATVSMRFGAVPQGTLSRLLAATLGRLAAGVTRRALAQDLADIAAAAERLADD